MAWEGEGRGGRGDLLQPVLLVWVEVDIVEALGGKEEMLLVGSGGEVDSMVLDEYSVVLELEYSEIELAMLVSKVDSGELLGEDSVLEGRGFWSEVELEAADSEIVVEKTIVLEAAALEISLLCDSLVVVADTLLGVAVLDGVALLGDSDSDSDELELEVVSLDSVVDSDADVSIVKDSELDVAAELLEISVLDGRTELSVLSGKLEVSEADAEDEVKISVLDSGIVLEIVTSVLEAVDVYMKPVPSDGKGVLDWAALLDISGTVEGIWLEEVSVDDEVSESVDDGSGEFSAVDLIVSKVVTATVTVCTDEVLTSVGSELDAAAENVLEERAPDSDVVEVVISAVEAGTGELSDCELDACAELIVRVSVSEAALEKPLEVIGGGTTEDSDEL